MFCCGKNRTVILTAIAFVLILSIALICTFYSEPQQSRNIYVPPGSGFKNETTVGPEDIVLPNDYVLKNPSGIHLSDSDAAGGKYYGVHVMSGGYRADIQNWITSNGGTIEWLSTGGEAYVSLPANKLQEMLQQNFTKYFGPTPPEAKIEKKLLEQILANPQIEFNVTVSILEKNESISRPLITPYFTTLRGYSGPLGSTFYWGVVTGSNILKIAELPIIENIQKSGGTTPSNMNGLPAVGADIVYLQTGYTGSGIRVEVTDTGVAYNSTTQEYHPDLPTPVVQYDYCHEDSIADDETGHGTLVSGNLLGRGIRTQKYKGIAHESELVAYKFVGADCSRDLFQRLLKEAINNDSVISSNSWQLDENDPSTYGAYSDQAKWADEASLGLYGKRITILFSAGNKDVLTLDPATCKNCITVGQSEVGNSIDSNPPGDVTLDSAYGPINGRTKPDLIAPGTFITSTWPWYKDCLFPVGDPYYCRSTGTSIAAPYVSGIAAVMMQKDPWLKEWPEAVKAKLINSAIKLPGVNDSKQGHGHVSGYDAVYNQTGIFETVLLVNDTFYSNNTYRNYSFAVASGVKEVKVTLVYSDNAQSTLVQNLSLYIKNASDSTLCSDERPDPVKNCTITSGLVGGVWKAQIFVGQNITRAVNYSVVASIRYKDPELSLYIKPNASFVKNGDTVKITTNLTNTGHTTVGSYIDIKNGTGLTLKNVTIYRADNVNFTLNYTETYITSDFYRVSFGEVVNSYPRKAEWIFEVVNSGNKILNIPIRYGAMNFNMTETETGVVLNGLNFSAGWNLISFPQLPSNKSVKYVFSAMSGNFTKLQTYNASASEWKSYDVRPPENFTMPAENISFAGGYWVLATQASQLNIIGFTEQPPASLTLHLKQGWNLISWPHAALTIKDALRTIEGDYTKIQTMIDGTWKSCDTRVPAAFNTLHSVMPGRGYWILMRLNDTLTIGG